MLNITIANNCIQRAMGLIGRSGLSPDEGLLIPRCCRVHTVGLRFAIDAVFLDADGIVVAVFSGLFPWKYTPRIEGAVSCLELAAGGAVRHHLRLGETIPYQIIFSLMHAGGLALVTGGN